MNYLRKLINKWFPDELILTRESELIYKQLQPRTNIKQKKIIIVSTPKVWNDMSEHWNNLSLEQGSYICGGKL